MLQKVVRSTVIDAPIERRLGNPPRLQQPRPLAPRHRDEFRIEIGDPSNQIGCVRKFSVSRDGNHFREQLLTLADREHHVSTYCILEGTLPMQRYVATVR